MSSQHPGRKPKPTQLHVLHGTYNPTRHGRDRDGEVQPEALNPAPPEGLSDNARQHWQQIMESLGEAGILAAMDRDALILYCETWSRWSEANAMLERHGLVFKSPKDNKTPVLSPYFKVSLQTGDQLRRLLTEFGMTPVSRVGLKGKPKPDVPAAGSLAAWMQERA